MRAKPLLSTTFAALLFGCGDSGTPATVADSAVVPIPAYAAADGQSDGAAVFEAASAFVATLTPGQAAKLTLPFDSPLRPTWSNLPAGILDFERNGLRLGVLSPEQLARLFAFLAAGLSRHGYDTMAQVVTADAVLSESWLAERLAWSADNYWIAFFGEPTANGQWGWQFGGHHLAVNASLAGGRIVSLSPTFVGIEPAAYTFDGVAFEPLADEMADGLALMAALPPEVQGQVLLDKRPREVYAGAGEDGMIPMIEGAAVAAWPEDLRGRLLDIISHWLRLQPEEHALARLAALTAELDEMHFAWHGETDGSGPVYYRIQGPTLILEFSTEGGVGSGAGHFHSVYRDPTMNTVGHSADDAFVQRA